MHQRFEMSNASITQFIEKYKTAKNHNSKEMRLTIQEAEQLTISLATLMAKELELSDKVIKLQEEIMNGVEVNQDGGGF